MSPRIKHSPRYVQGAMLMESMVAILVLALGLLGLLGTHLRTLAQTQDSARRLQAIRLIEDLAERIRIHPPSHVQPALFMTQGWVESNPHSPDLTCQSSSCSATQLAQHSRIQWTKNVAAALPMGQANVFAAADSQHLGVMVAWRRNEGALGAALALVPAAFGAGEGNANVQCPAERSCHFQLIHVASW